MKKVLVLAAFLAVLAGCSSLAPVQNLSEKMVLLAPGVTMEEAILKGGAAKRWRMKVERPGLITAKLFARQHVVIVNIPYTDNSYAIEYYFSENMNYKPKKHKIHHKYNQWVRNLDAAITRAAATTKKTTQTIATTSAAVIQQTGE